MKPGQPVWTFPCALRLIAAFVGGLSAGYFYGGVTPLSLILIHAPVGCLSDSAGESPR